jgi:hypothetical protein
MASADLFGRVLPRADTADLRLMLCSSFALANQTPNPLHQESILRCGRILDPRSELRRRASDQLADADQGIVFLLLSLLEAYLCAIEEEASVTLRYLQTLPL